MTDPLAYFRNRFSGDEPAGIEYFRDRFSDTVTDPLSGKEIPKALVPKREPPEPVEDVEDLPYLPQWLRKVGTSALSGATSVADLVLGGPSRLIEKTTGVEVPSPMREIGKRAGFPVTPSQAAEMAAVKAQELDERATERLAEASVDLPEDSTSGRNPFASRARLGYWSAEVVGGLLDPLELLPGGMFARGVTKGARALRSGAEVAETAGRKLSPEEAAEFADLATTALKTNVPGEAGEAVARKEPGKLTFLDPVGKDLKTIAVRAEDGSEVGHIRVRPEDGGGHSVDWIEVDPAYRRTGVGTALHKKAAELYGPRAGSTLTTTPEGEALVGKLAPPEEPFQYTAGSLDLPASARKTVKQTMESEAVLRRRRTGIKTDYGEPERLQAELGLTEDDFLQVRPGTVFNAEEHALLDSYVSKYGRRSEELRLQAAADMTAGKNTPAVLEFSRARNRFIDLLGISMAGRTETGRALQSFKQLRRALDSPESLREYLVRKLACKGVL